MASGAVRELITKIKFQIDKASESKAKSTMQELKRQLNNFAKNPTKAKIGIDTTRATTALQGIKSQLNSLQGKTVTTYVQTKQKGASASAVAKGGGKSGGNGGNTLADNAGTLAATGAAMVAPLALPVSTAMDFEAAMSKVKAITNSTDEDMARLTATARELGASTQYSASEAAAAMSYLGMAGWKTEQIIAGMPGLLDLAAASGEDLARVADIVSDDLTAFKMPAEQAAHMADVMAAASTNANTNVSMMGETFKYAGSIAGALGYSLEDVALATGLMANSGIKAEMAGTALRSIMNRMIDPPKAAAESLAQLGVSATNADGTVKPFRQQLIELRNAMAGLTDAEKAEMAGNIAGTEAMSGFLAVISASDADFAKMAGAVDNADGAASKMAKTMNDNAKGAMKEFKSSVEECEIIVGGAFLEAITKATKAVTKFVQEFGKFAKEHPQFVGGIMAAVAVIGGLLVVLGGVGLAVSGVATAVGALAPIFTALGGAISGALAFLSSWGTVFAGIFGGIGTLLSGALAGIAGFISSFIASISAMFSGGLIGVLTGAFRGAVSLIMGLFSPINVAIMAVIGVILLLKEHWNEVVAWFAPGIESMEEGLAQLASAWEKIAPIVDALMPLFKNVALLLGSVIVGAVSLLWRFFTAAFNAIAGLINWVAGLLGGLGETIQWIAGGLSGLIDKALQFIGLKGQIEGVNSSITQKWAERAMGGNTNTQNINVGSINVPTASDVGAGIGSLATTPTYFPYG